MSRFKEQKTLKPVGSLQKYLQNSICVHEASFESDILYSWRGAGDALRSVAVRWRKSMA
jgi:hypothetical protein